MEWTSYWRLLVVSENNFCDDMGIAYVEILDLEDKVTWITG